MSAWQKALLALVLVALLGLACGEQVVYPTSELPAFEEAEAIAIVQTWLNRAPAGEGSNCLAMMNLLSQGETSWSADYLGQGEWQVLYAFQSRTGSGGGFTGPGGTWVDPVITTRNHRKEWRVFEASQSISPLYSDDGGRLLRILHSDGC